MVFGVIFGAATVYLALKAGLTVSASIPIAVLAISVFKRFGSSTILENNIVQTIGSAGESIAAGVVFTLPGFLFLSRDPATGVSVGEPYFSYWTILTLAMVGGVLGVLMMIPLRRSLIVKEHATLPYPEGTACASVLIAGERGGDLARTAYQGLGFAFVYAFLQKVFRFIAETPTLAIRATNRYLPAAVLSGDITPEYLGVGYIIGPQIAGVLVAGGVLAWLGLIPLLTVVTPPDTIAAQLVKLGYLGSLLDRRRPRRLEPGHARLRRHGRRRLPRLRPPDRRRRGRRGRLHHAAQDAADDRLVVQGERGVAAPPSRRRRCRAPSAICRSPSCSSAR